MSNTEWNIVPNVSANGIKFGTDRSVVRKTLGKPKQIFKKTAESVNTTDAYADFHVYYSADDKLEAIEIFGRDITLSINSRQIFPGTISTAKEILPDLAGEYDNYISKTSSVGICTEDDTIMSILIGCKDYYK